MKTRQYAAALFDLDGVVFDTEPQYTIFWGGIAREFRPDIPRLEHLIKGQTLTQIYDGYFPDQAMQAEITRRLNDYETRMRYNYIDGLPEFVKQLHKAGIPTAIVTSSNRDKMANVYRQKPDFNTLFDKVLTSEDFTASKPDPDCYIKAAAAFGVPASRCIGFEDSFNGLKALRSSGARVIGLATTNSREAIAPLSDKVIDNYIGVTLDSLE